MTDDDEEFDPVYAAQRKNELIGLWLPQRMNSARFGSFSYHPGDPYVRTYSLGDDACEVAVQMARQTGTLAIDIETDGLAEESFTVKVIIIASASHACVLDGFNPKHVTAAKEAISLAKSLIFHNSPFDVPPLVHLGAMTLADIKKVTDTLILARQAFTDSIAGRGLADLEKSVLRVDASRLAKDRFAQWCKINKYTKSEGFKKVKYSDPAYTMYAGYDGVVTARLLDPLIELALIQLTHHPFGKYGADRAQAIKLIAREQQVNRVVLHRTAKGLTFDQAKMLAEQARIMELQSDNAETLKGFGIENPSNRNELVDALIDAAAFPADYPVTGKTKRPSTAAKNLGKIRHAAVAAFKAYDDNNRLMNYLETSRKIAVKTDGRLHPTVAIMKAVTGRMSYSNPATHQFTEAAREMIMGDELPSGDYDRLTSIDWSQAEPVIAANLSGDISAIETYEAFGDLYQAAADAGKVLRKQAKVILLAMLYQQGLASLARSLGMTMSEAREVRRMVASAVPMTDRLTAWAVEWSRVAGKTWTLSGRIVDVNPRFAYRGANYVIQGSQYDMLADAICEIDNQGMSEHFMLAQHDELVVSTSVAVDVMEIMRKPGARLIELSERVPVFRVDRADLGTRWRTSHPCECGSETALRYEETAWTCEDHHLTAA